MTFVWLVIILPLSPSRAPALVKDNIQRYIDARCCSYAVQGSTFPDDSWRRIEPNRAIVSTVAKSSSYMSCCDFGVPYSRGTCGVDCVTAHFCGFEEDLDQKLSSDSTSGQSHSAIHVAAHTQDTCCETCVTDPLCAGAVYLSKSSSTDSSVKLRMLQPGCHVTTGGLNIEHVEEIFTSQVGLVDRFDWFKNYCVGFITCSLDSCSVLVHVPGT